MSSRPQCKTCGVYDKCCPCFYRPLVDITEWEDRSIQNIVAYTLNGEKVNLDRYDIVYSGGEWDAVWTDHGNKIIEQFSVNVFEIKS